ncbi:MAG: hypothetical protein ABJG88_13445 [Litorimonas sp.]
MTERPIPSFEKLDSDSIENRAADIDYNVPGWSKSGSAVSFGEGVYLSNGHNFISNGSSATTNYTVTLREGHSTDAGDQTITNANVTNIGNYIGPVTGVSPTPVAPATGRQDMVAFTVPGVDGPNSSAIVFENQKDMAGHVRSAGYPGSGAVNPVTGVAYNNETLMVTDGPLSSSSMETAPAYQTDFVRADADSTSWSPTLLNPLKTTTTEGLAAVGGQSGSGVDIAMDLKSDDNRLEGVELNNQLSGLVTYASNSPGVSQTHSPTSNGAGITPITPNAYQGLANVAEAAVQTNNQMALKAAGTPVAALSDQQVADKFDTQILMTDQQAVNGSTETDFNGTMLNEVSYMNQNVNMTMDMGAGTDTADYYFLDKGINVEINTLSIDVDKTYTAITPINIGSFITVVPVSNTATDKLTNTENIVGTGSSDKFLVNDLAGVQSIDGRDLPPGMFGFAYTENDTLTLGDTVGPVAWAFNKNDDGSIDRTSGTVSDGTNSFEFSGIENVTTRDGDTVNGVVQGEAVKSINEAPLVPEQAKSKSTSSVNEASLDQTIESLGTTPPFIPFKQVVKQFADDRELLRVSDPEAALSVTQAANHPEAEATLVRLDNAGIERFPSEAIEGDTAEVRVGNILTNAHEIDKVIEAERVLEQGNSNVQQTLNYQDEYDHSFDG